MNLGLDTGGQGPFDCIIIVLTYEECAEVGSGVKKNLNAVHTI